MISQRLTTSARSLLLKHRLTQVSRKFSDHHAVPESFKHLVRPTMDAGYPLPKQTYAEAFSYRQAKTNKFLALSIVSFLASCAYLYVSDTFDILTPPPRKVNLEAFAK